MAVQVLTPSKVEEYPVPPGKVWLVETGETLTVEYLYDYTFKVTVTAPVPVQPGVPTGDPNVTGADVLVRAADLFEEFGWNQGVDQLDTDGDGVIDSFCARGAIRRAACDLGRPDLFIPAMNRADDFLSRQRIHRDGIVSFNDWNGTGKKAVVHVLREAAK